MLISSLLILLVAMPLYSNNNLISPILFNRIVSIVFILSALLSINSFYIESLSSGINIYSGLFHVTSLSLAMDTLFFIVGAAILSAWSNPSKSIGSKFMNPTSTSVPTVTEYSLILLFSTIGSSLLMSSSDLLSVFLSLELQSFGVYIIATLYRDSESATSAGLKYFLLGGFSSALILLGFSFIYYSTGLTQIESISSLLSVVSTHDSFNHSLILGFIVLLIGLLFKVSAAPFHSWAPDVYDGVPTIVTSWLTTLPKLSIFSLILYLQLSLTGLGNLEVLSISNDLFNEINIWKNTLLLSSLLSLIIGTVVGLAQNRIKRLLAFSTISHVGFLLLALAMNNQDSISSFIFYLIQYTLTNLNTFLIILALGYLIKSNTKSQDMHMISDFKGLYQLAPLLTFSLIICLFSMAGIPPLLGFFAKQQVLLSSLEAGYWFLSLIAILVSVISAAYYLKIVRIMYFNASSNDTISQFNGYRLTSLHAFIISLLTFILVLFVINPTILLNSCNLLALSYFNI